MTGTRGRIGTIAVLVGVAVVAMLIAFVTGESDSRRSGPPLDPRSTIDSGARAAVILLEQQGRSVSIGSATSPVDTFLVLDDNLQATERERLLDRVEHGADLVIADGRSDLVETASRASTVRDGIACELSGLTSVADIDVGVVPGLVAGDLGNCFPVGSGWFLTVTSRGEGRVIALSSSRVFTNSRIDEGHNAALVVGVLAMTEGEIRIVQALPGAGDRTLVELIGEPAWAALALLVIAFVTYGAHRARRLGQPVTETDPVEIAGSELVRATARLYRKADGRGHVVEAIRGQLRRDLATRWALDEAEPIDSVVRRLQLADDEETHVRDALTAPVPQDEAGFTQLVGSCVRARRTIRGTHE